MANIFSKEIRTVVGEWVESPRIQAIIVLIIVFNAVTLGLETSEAIVAKYGFILSFIDSFILGIFILEILLKLYAFGWRFFKSGWNIFDFVIVAIALMPSSGSLSVLRALRILRILRLISFISQLRLIVEALLKSLPGIASIAGLVLLMFYVSAVISTRMFGESFPEFFGTIGASMYTLFQVMTLESWSAGVARPVMELYPYAWLFFIPFILFTTFTMLNLFVAIIVDTMQQVHKKDRDAAQQLIQEAQQAAESEQQLLLKEIQGLKGELKELRLLLEKRPISD
ncbi:ion transporter [Thioflexithrix psekupsensis]|uniref:Voltage-gated sodium channel n=1 Tax=Thioflexithrix psekupsensis TaxID=1570016 RepID=A0A251XBX0_9GAMM|nr:ion transporter [Thioflexithrix psekupsensis]OUD16043.1 voltage-gated sodium channel [Thioflexithrix psekupsensis]